MPYSAKRAGPAVSVGVLSGQPSPLEPTRPPFELRATLISAGGSWPVRVLVDSRAENNFHNTEFAHQAGVPLAELAASIRVNALDGKLLTTITHQTAPPQLVISGNHHKQLPFKVLSSPSTSVVLGHPWLQAHNPHIDWSAGLAVPPTVEAETPEKGTSPDLSAVPQCYHDLAEVFNMLMLFLCPLTDLMTAP